MLKINGSNAQIKCESFVQVLSEYASLGRRIYEMADESERKIMIKEWNKTLCPTTTTEDMAFMLEKTIDEILAKDDLMEKIKYIPTDDFDVKELLKAIKSRPHGSNKQLDEKLDKLASLFENANASNTDTDTDTDNDYDIKDFLHGFNDDDDDD